jgi:hypothetical protein
MGIKTPFFKAFGPLLFGRAPRKALAELQEIDSLEQLYGLFGDLIPRKLLGASDKGVNSRDRGMGNLPHRNRPDQDRPKPALS